jgi:hypothetical protein
MQVSIAAVVKRSVPVPRRRRPHHRSAPTVARVTATSVATPRAADDTAPILVPDGAGIWMFGDHLSAEMVKQGILKAREKLIDLSLRNGMLNYRHSESSSRHVRVINRTFFHGKKMQDGLCRAPTCMIADAGFRTFTQ